MKRKIAFAILLGIFSFSGYALSQKTEVKKPAQPQSLGQQPGRPRILTWEALPPGFNSFPAVSSLAFLADGTLVTANDDANLRLWDGTAATPKTVAEIKGMPRCGTFANPFAFSADGRIAASVDCGGHEVKVWDVSTAAPLTSLLGNPRYYMMGWSGGATGHSAAGHIAFSSDSKLIAVAGVNLWDKSKPGMIQIWDMATGKVLQTLQTEMTVVSLSFSPDGKTLVSAGGNLGKGIYYQGSGKDGEVKLWDVSSGKLLRSMPGMAVPVRAAAFSPDGQTLALGGQRNDISLWDTQTGEMRQTLAARAAGSPAPHPHTSIETLDVHALVYSPDGKVLAGADSHAIHLWDALTGKVLPALPMTGTIAFSPDSRTLAVTSGRQAALFQLQ